MQAVVVPRLHVLGACFVLHVLCAHFQLRMLDLPAWKRYVARLLRGRLQMVHVFFCGVLVRCLNRKFRLTQVHTCAARLPQVLLDSLYPVPCRVFWLMSYVEVFSCAGQHPVTSTQVRGRQVGTDQDYPA